MSYLGMYLIGQISKFDVIKYYFKMIKQRADYLIHLNHEKTTIKKKREGSSHKKG